MPKPAETVNQFMEKLEHPLKGEIEAVRAIISDSNDQITEHIKWNALSYRYNGEDRVTFNLHAKDRIQLVFHRGGKVKGKKDFRFEDSAGILEWVADDRGIVQFHSMEDVEAKKAALTKVVNEWMKSTVE